MGKTVHGVVICNPMTPLDAKKSGALMFAVEASALEIGYSEYRAQDSKLGATKEIRSAQRVGKQENGNFRLLGSDRLNFMPTATVMNIENPRGLSGADDSNLSKIRNQKIMKSMGLKMETLDNAMVKTSTVPVIGSKEWIPYRKAFIAAGGNIAGEGAHRSQLAIDAAEKEEGMKDVTNMSVGYFGRVDTKLRVAPMAMYHTFLACLLDASSKKFTIKNKDLTLEYEMQEYYHLERGGVIEGNTSGKAGYSRVYTEEYTPNSINVKGATVLAGSGPKSIPTGPGTPTNPIGKISNRSLVIQVQVSNTSYREIVLGGLNQRTTVSDGKNKKEVNSAFPSKDEKKSKDFDFDDYYMQRSFIPLTKDSMLKVSLFRKANLLIECKCSVVQVVDVQKKPWWASGFFKVILFIASMVINYFFFGTGTILQTLITTGIQMAIGYGVTYILQALVDAGIITNGWVAAVLEVVAVASALYFATGINVDMTNITVVMKLLEATGKSYAYEMQMENKKYKEAMARIKKEKDKLDEMDDDYDKLHTSAKVGRLMLAAKRRLEEVDVPIFESRDEFLQRTTSMSLQTEDISFSGLMTRQRLA